MAFISSAFTMAIIATAVTILPKLLGRKTKSAKSKISKNGVKSIDLANFVLWGLYGVSSLFLFVGIGVYLFTDEPWAGIAFIMMGLVFLFLTAIIHFADTSVEWTTEYISGAKSGTSFKKNRLLWDDVISANFLPNQTIKISDTSGKNIFLSVYQNGWHEIIEDLRHIRPDISTCDFK